MQQGIKKKEYFEKFEINKPKRLVLSRILVLGLLPIIHQKSGRK
jgi:hypothetical protein